MSMMRSGMTNEDIADFVKRLLGPMAALFNVTCVVAFFASDLATNRTVATVTVSGDQLANSA